MADPNQPSSFSLYDQSAGTKRKRTMDQEQEYLKLVRDTFGPNDHVRFPVFLRVMKGYHRGKYDTSEIITFAQEIFEGHHELLTGFNILLPRGYSIDSVAPKKDLPKELRDIMDPIILMNKIKARLQNDKHCYNSYLDLLLKYQMNLCPDEIVLKELPIVFQDYPDLLAELQIIFPKDRRTFTREIDLQKVQKHDRRLQIS